MSWLVEQIDAAPHWERQAPVPFSTVSSRHLPDGDQDPDEHKTALIDAVNASGRAFLPRVKLNGNHATTHEYVARVWYVASTPPGLEEWGHPLQLSLMPGMQIVWRPPLPSPLPLGERG